MPTRRLPADPNLTQLKQQAKDLLRAQRERKPDACQRIREFHPRFRRSNDDEIAAAPLQLSDAQLAIAREYGFASWPRIKAHVEHPQDDIRIAHHLRIRDEAFLRAVDLLDAGDAEGLLDHLRLHPSVVFQRMRFEGGNYFREPTLLEFIAENPTRRGSLPPNAAQIARIILDAGAREDRARLNSALDLVASSDVARKSGVKDALLDVLCEYGADPNSGTYTASLYGEFDAVERLIQHGATPGLLVSASMNRLPEARAALADADDETRQKALAVAAQYGYVDILRLLLDAGADPNRFAPVGGHSHSTPLHQAALGGHQDAVRLLVERGARADTRDILFGGTPLGWAEYGKHEVTAEYLRGFGAETGFDPS